MTHPIPPAALSQHIGVLGKNGSGKSYAVRGVVETLLDEKARVCVIDPTGVWYGLRTLADGKRAGYPVAIFGGPHADFPLQQHHGEELAEILGGSNTPAILDVSLLRTGERTRLFTDFAESLMRKNRGPLHLIIDEAHLFAPQGRVNDPQSGAMLHAANNLVSLGRSRGLRVVLISQRPAKVHKDSLTQVETLIAMRLIAPQDRKAVEEWIKDNTDATQAKDILSSLATLKTGQGWVWAPEMGILERVSFPRIRTLDTGRTPDGSEIAGKVLAPIDKDAITARLKVVAQEAEANDPKRLRAQIADLERQLKVSPKQFAQRSFEDYEAGKADGERAGFARGIDAGREAQRALISTIRLRLDDMQQALVEMIETPIATAPVPGKLKSGTAPSTMIPRRQPAAPWVPAKARANGESTADLPRGEAAIMQACIEHPHGVARETLTVLAGFKKSSRDAYVQRLRGRGFVDVVGDRVVATDAGRAALPDAEPLPRGADLQRHWLARLPEGERKILQQLLEAYPEEVERDALTDAVGYKKSSRDAYLQRLKARQLIETNRGGVRAVETLFA